ncbi:7287_t:CDS:2, partial [Acaulospora colombiana]
MVTGHMGLVAREVPSALIAELIETFTNMNASRFTCGAGLVVMLYDWCLTIGTEVEVIWMQKMSLSSILYLVNRYLPVPFLLMFNYRKVLWSLARTLVNLFHSDIAGLRNAVSDENPISGWICLLRCDSALEVDDVPSSKLFICLSSRITLLTNLQWAVAPGSLWYMANQLEFAMMVALVSRFHLNLRTVANPGTAVTFSNNATATSSFGVKGHHRLSMPRALQRMKGEEISSWQGDAEEMQVRHSTHQMDGPTPPPHVDERILVIGNNNNGHDLIKAWASILHSSTVMMKDIRSKADPLGFDV